MISYNRVDERGVSFFQGRIKIRKLYAFPKNKFRENRRFKATLRGHLARKLSRPVYGRLALFALKAIVTWSYSKCVCTMAVDARKSH